MIQGGRVPGVFAAAADAYFLPIGVPPGGGGGGGSLGAGGGAPRAYSVAFEARLTQRGIGEYAAHFAEANEQLLQAMADAETASTLKATLGADFEGSIVSSCGEGRGVSPSGWSWHPVKGEPGLLQRLPRTEHAVARRGSRCYIQAG